MEKFKQFLNSTKYVQAGDLIEMGKGMMVVVESEDASKPSKRNIGYFVENQKSSLFQVTSVPSLKFPIKRKLKKNTELSLSSYEDIQNSTLPNQPPGLSQCCDILRKLITPFVSHRTITDSTSSNISVALPTFLLIGPSGSGKRLVVKSVADIVGPSLY